MFDGKLQSDVRLQCDIINSFSDCTALICTSVHMMYTPHHCLTALSSESAGHAVIMLCVAMRSAAHYYTHSVETARQDAINMARSGVTPTLYCTVLTLLRRASAPICSAVHAVDVHSQQCLRPMHGESRLSPRPLLQCRTLCRHCLL